ncbi:LOW QUALITY PROTEIN: hypothetical protein PHPALM_27842 [Phytophthora palmivora]|uniref:Uncharacterized protein n=1 Tax=Phytophthora palmivora TaxID=4796 RepID=A0A2P4XBN6_9STRA|nr:LOW QUALITY PROTEIN: hypothetical protein PHPALM_27842 [Phytophthora palmivora]
MAHQRISTNVSSYSVTGCGFQRSTSAIENNLGEETTAQMQHVPIARVQPTRRTDLHFAGYAFTSYHASASKQSYRCSSYRRTECKEKLHFDVTRNEYTLSDEHICKKSVKMIAPGLDVTESMKETTDTIAITRMDLTAERTWKHIRSEVYPEELALAQFGLTREQVIQRVHRSRRDHFGADLHGIVEVPPLSLVPGTAMSDSETSVDDVWWSDTDSDEEETNPGSWKYIHSSRVHLQVDDVDTLLLEKARVEADYVVERLLQRMFGTTQHNTASISVSRILSTWLDLPIISKLQQFVNVRLADDTAVTVDELFESGTVAELLSCNTIMLFDKENSKQYRPAQTCMQFKRYRSILAALGTTNRQETVGTNQWAAPFSPDRDTTYAAELIRRLCADIGFVSGATIASLDDDLIRLRSASVDDIGLAHIRNPKKGHGIVSLGTGLFLGGHVAARGESTVDIVRILKRSLCGASTESQIRLPGIIHALDRGYQSEPVNQQITNAGGSIIGTHKRTGSMCRDGLLPVSGRKNDLINRLLGSSTTASPEPDESIENARFTIDEALLSTWVMAPFSTSDTKIGSANEENIAVQISSFLDKHSQYHIERLKSYGLLCRRGMPIAAFSPDNVASILNTRRGRFHAIMEYKTRTTARTVQKEQVLANSWGRFLTVDVSAMDFGGRLCDVIPEASHRLQLLHSIACGGLQDGFLVYASATAIIRVVHVVVEPGGYLTWIYDDNAAVPHFDPAQLGHCMNQSTLEQNLIMWKTLVKLIDDKDSLYLPRSTSYQRLLHFGIA